MSARHSAIFIDKNARSSGIFNNRRGSDAGLTKKTTGEPVLTDYVKRTQSPSKNDINKNYGLINSDKQRNSPVKSIFKDNFLRPRREKTESEIVLRNSEARRSIRETLEARRREMETQFADSIGRRGSRPTDVSAMNLSTGTNSSTEGEGYVFLQVNFGLFFFIFTFFRVLS